MSYDAGRKAALEKFAAISRTNIVPHPPVRPAPIAGAPAAAVRAAVGPMPEGGFAPNPATAIRGTPAAQVNTGSAGGMPQAHPGTPGPVPSSASAPAAGGFLQRNGRALVNGGLGIGATMLLSNALGGNDSQ